MSEKMRCPFRVKALDHPDTCDEKCAWLMTLSSAKHHRACAVSVLARSTRGAGAWEIVNKASVLEGGAR